jgi:GntR family transcriptional regulator/MocR family aminotransferase
MRSGALSLGERLPSTRALARDLSLSRVTVEAAYGQLAIEGYLRRNVGKGSFVAIDLGAGSQSPIPAPHRSPGSFTPFSQRGRRLLETGGCMEPMRLQAFPPAARICAPSRWRFGGACSTGACAWIPSK